MTSRAEIRRNREITGLRVLNTKLHARLRKAEARIARLQHRLAGKRHPRWARFWLRARRAVRK